MADKRKHRGPHPEDHELFRAEIVPTLTEAFGDFCWLLDRGYAVPSSLKLVGDRYSLQERQRTAVKRAACTSADRDHRASKHVDALGLPELWIDGFNLLTTIEAALAGGIVLVGRDGCYRDMASMHGTYRSVEETEPAIQLIGNFVASKSVGKVRWLLDQPVSNSGRLAAKIRETATANVWPWEVEIVRDPDPVLSQAEGIVVVTADSEILNHCERWTNVAAEIVKSIETATVVDFTS